MKKTILRVLSMGAAMAMVLTLAACSGNTASSGSSSTTSSTASSEAAGTSAPASSAADSSSTVATGTASFETVEDYFNDAEMQSQIKALQDSLVDSGMDLKIESEGNQAIYTYTFAEGTEVDAEVLESGLDEQEESFQSAVGQIAGMVKQADVSLVVRYVDGEGKEITSREFTN